MLKIAVIGGGSHSRSNHLPALARYVSLHPGEVELAAFCDLRGDVAESVSREYGFARRYTDVEEMLGGERLDGCIAVTPISATVGVARLIIAAGIPLLMEKPPGVTLKETDEICTLAESRTARVMVSMNRRFDPAISRACAWRAGRPVRYLRASMFRQKRREPEFLVATGIHCVDAVRSIAGNVRDYSVRARQADGVWSYAVDLEFENDAIGVVEIMPNCGSKAESYEMFGAGYRVLARAGEVDDGSFTTWENGRIAERTNPTEGMPSFVTNGTYAETEEFVAAIRNGRDPHPTPAEARQSVEICHRIQVRCQRQ